MARSLVSWWFCLLSGTQDVSITLLAVHGRGGGFDTGGQTWLGHNDEVMAGVRELLIPAHRAPAP